MKCMHMFSIFENALFPVHYKILHHTFTVDWRNVPHFCKHFLHIYHTKRNKREFLKFTLFYFLLSEFNAAFFLLWRMKIYFILRV